MPSVLQEDQVNQVKPVDPDQKVHQVLKDHKASQVKMVPMVTRDELVDAVLEATMLKVRTVYLVKKVQMDDEVLVVNRLRMARTELPERWVKKVRKAIKDHKAHQVSEDYAATPETTENQVKMASKVPKAKKDQTAKMASPASQVNKVIKVHAVKMAKTVPQANPVTPDDQVHRAFAKTRLVSEAHKDSKELTVILVHPVFLADKVPLVQEVIKANQELQETQAFVEHVVQEVTMEKEVLKAHRVRKAHVEELADRVKTVPQVLTDKCKVTFLLGIVKSELFQLVLTTLTNCGTAILYFTLKATKDHTPKI